MRNLLLVAALMAGSTLHSYAQDIVAGTQPKLEHRIAVQANELVRQVLNFGGTNNAATQNPYILTYNVNAAKSGWGLRAGIGYTANNSKTGDGITLRHSNINDVQFRLGVEKAFQISKRWSMGLGVDAIYHNNDDKTSAVSISFDTVNVNTNSNITKIGGGVMSWLRYSISDRLQIGTETSFYYLTGTEYTKVVSTRSNQGSPVQQESITDADLSEGKFNVPMVFYLSVRF